MEDGADTAVQHVHRSLLPRIDLLQLQSRTLQVNVPPRLTGRQWTSCSGARGPRAGPMSAHAHPPLPWPTGASKPAALQLTLQQAEDAVKTDASAQKSPGSEHGSPKYTADSKGPRSKSPAAKEAGSLQPAFKAGFPYGRAVTPRDVAVRRKQQLQDGGLPVHQCSTAQHYLSCQHTLRAVWNALLSISRKLDHALYPASDLAGCRINADWCSTSPGCSLWSSALHTQGMHAHTSLLSYRRPKLTDTPAHHAVCTHSQGLLQHKQLLQQQGSCREGSGGAGSRGSPGSSKCSSPGLARIRRAGGHTGWQLGCCWVSLQEGGSLWFGPKQPARDVYTHNRRR